MSQVCDEAIERLAAQITLLWNIPDAWSHIVADLDGEEQNKLASELLSYYGDILDPADVQECKVMPAIVRKIAADAVLVMIANNRRAGMKPSRRDVGAKLVRCPICGGAILKVISVEMMRPIAKDGDCEDYVQFNLSEVNASRPDRSPITLIGASESGEKERDYVVTKRSTPFATFRCEHGHNATDWLRFATGKKK
jgi:hypothetical protein